MPTYQYRCPHCGHEFEEFQSITDDPIDTCPKCGNRPQRLISGGAGLLFKGSGFYITDHRSESYKSAAAKEKSSGDASGSSKSSDKSGGDSSGSKATAKVAESG